MGNSFINMKLFIIFLGLCFSSISINGQKMDKSSKITWSAYALLTSFDMCTVEKYVPYTGIIIPLEENKFYEKGEVYPLKINEYNYEYKSNITSLGFNMGIQFAYIIAPNLSLNISSDLGVQSYVYDISFIENTTRVVGRLEIIESGVYSPNDVSKFISYLDENISNTATYIPTSANAFNVYNRLSLEYSFLKNFGVEVGTYFGNQFEQVTYGQTNTGGFSITNKKYNEINNSLFGIFGNLNVKFGRRNALSLFYQKSLVNFIGKQSEGFITDRKVFPMHYGVKYSYSFGINGNGTAQYAKQGPRKTFKKTN